MVVMIIYAQICCYVLVNSPLTHARTRSKQVDMLTKIFGLLVDKNEI